MFGKNVNNKEFMDKELIDRGSYYEIKDYKPIVEHDESGNLVSVIYCPYIPKFRSFQNCCLHQIPPERRE